MTPEALYVQLGRIVEEMPNLFEIREPVPPEVLRWFGRAHALVRIVDIGDAVALKRATEQVMSNLVAEHSKGVQTLPLILYRALGTAELKAPASAQGAFIPAGSAFDALAAFSKVLGTAGSEILLIDPYMDEKALTDYAVLASEGVPIRLLSDQHHHKPSLAPAVKAWSIQHGAKRPLAAKLTPPRTLHDRLVIVDQREAWVFTQSMNAFATRAPASIVRSDAETAALKVAAYGAIWNAATDIP